MRPKYCVIGLGVFGSSLCRYLTALNAEVLAIGDSDASVGEIKDVVTQAEIIKFSDLESIRKLGLVSYNAVFIALGSDFETSMTLTILMMTERAKAKDSRLKIYARALSSTHKKLLELVGVDRIVVPEESAARSFAHLVSVTAAINGYDLGDKHIIIEVPAPAGFVGKTLRGLAPLFDGHQVLLVTIKRPIGGVVEMGAKLCFGPDVAQQYKTMGRMKADDKFKPGDVLVLMGEERELRGFMNEKVPENDGTKKS